MYSYSKHVGLSVHLRVLWVGYVGVAMVPETKLDPSSGVFVFYVQFLIYLCLHFFELMTCLHVLLQKLHEEKTASIGYLSTVVIH